MRKTHPLVQPHLLITDNCSRKISCARATCSGEKQFGCAFSTLRTRSRGSRGGRSMVGTSSNPRPDSSGRFRSDGLSDGLKTLIEQSVAQDPRPAYQDIAERIYVMEIAGWEVKFKIEGQTAAIIQIKPIGAIQI